MEPPSLAKARAGLYTLAALATYVDKYCEVKIFDPSAVPLDIMLREFEPDIVGITSYTITYQESIDTMKTVRKICPEALRIIGGIHISCLPESLDDVFDAGVIGDGEETLRDLIRVGSRASIPEIEGVCWKANGGCIKVNKKSKLASTGLPVPQIHKYSAIPADSGSYAFITSRGCPFKCVFCYSPVMRGQVDHYPVNRVIDEFEYAVKVLKADYLMLLDDTVCLDIRRLNTLSDELNKRRLDGIRVAVNVRSSAMNGTLCRALQRLKVVSLNCGFESGSDRMLREIKGPSATVRKHLEAVKMARNYGFTLNGSFIFGMPGETIEDMQETLRFMEHLYAEKIAGRYKGNFWFFCATPFPGTEWWDYALARGKVSLDMNWNKLDIKDFQYHFLLDDSICEKDWQSIINQATEIVSRSNRIY